MPKDDDPRSEPEQAPEPSRQIEPEPDPYPRIDTTTRIEKGEPETRETKDDYWKNR